MNISINIGNTWKVGTATKIKLDTNLTNYNNWVNGETGSTTNWVAYMLFPTGTTVGRFNVTDPFGVSNVGWVASGKTTTPGTVTGGGFNAAFGDYNYITPIDPSFNYRVSVWINRQVVSGGTALLFGFFATAGTTVQNITNLTVLNVTGTTQQPAFINSTVPNNWAPANTWKLFVGYIHNSGYTGNNWFSGGTYTTAGVLTTGFTEFIFRTGIENITMRAYNSLCGYNAVTNFIYPRIDKMDGTEPSIATLLNNEGPWRTVNNIKINIGNTWKTAT